MKIIIPSVQVPFIRGGAELHIRGLRDALIKEGHEVEIVTLPFKFSPESYVEELIEIWKKQDFNHFNGHNIDRVIALQFPTYYVQHKHKTLWLMHQHRAVYELYAPAKASKETKHLRDIIHHNDSILLKKIDSRYSNSYNVAKRLKHYNHIDATPLYHPPANEERFYCELSEGFIFCPSRLESLKRQDLLIRAMQYTHSKAVAIIAGEGSRLNYYRKLIDELDLSHKVRIVGHISEEQKYVFYAKSLAVFFAPFDEDYGYITLEAMLSSKPVITCTDSGGPLEFVLEGETGFIVDPDPIQIAKEIDWLDSNQKKARIMGQNGRKHYLSKNITWKNVVETLLSS